MVDFSRILTYPRPVQKQMFMDSLKEARVVFGIVFCAHLLFLLINFNVPEVYSTPLIQSKPLPLTSYEVVQIGKVVSTPQAYILRLVRFKGKVTALRTLSRGRGFIPPEAHTFTLTDNSGAIEIFYTGAQGKNLGPVNTELLAEGNVIDVLVIISYTQPSGSEGGTVKANLTWVESVRD